MVGREQSRQTRKFACFGITRRKRDGWAGSSAGKLASLLALLWRGARRYGWVGSKASKLASLPALVERDARRSGWVGIKACLACLLASLLACLLQGRFSAPRQLPGFRSLLSGISMCILCVCVYSLFRRATRARAWSATPLLASRSTP